MNYLLIQVRNLDDPMRSQELRCFASVLHCSLCQIEVLNALTDTITSAHLARADMVLIGGSGHYSACGADRWLMNTLDGLRLLYESKCPTFASCWGFQALARALGGTVIKDPDNAELGTHEIDLTNHALQDPVFGGLPQRFSAQMGHEDRVVELPEGAIHLARTDRVEYQAYTFADRPIYATQFHPELSIEALMQRVQAYPEYVQLVAGMTIESFCASIRPTPDAAELIVRFARTMGSRQGNGPLDAQL